ncbi:SNF2 family N-terminal domain [Teratosphaeria destructans]|uniref:SNF2 family N-terminal domain n=1 Tax=Teratosphaeria destructans TaxID=418781 RepID=A0A9W7SIT8_9PEZI|nr:SNF2 family N-terminal domain [Teratosphaeria destructans]
MDSDPWTWDTAAVQQFFRRDAITYLKRRPGTQIPPMAFIQALADNDVDGPSLMDMMTPTLLREEFGVCGFRQRAAVMYCIAMLQKRSEKFETRFNSPSPQTPRSLPITPVVQPSDAVSLAEGVGENVRAGEQQTEDEYAWPSDAVPLAEGVGENVRTGEQQTEDKHGRKRRKLDLTKTHLQKNPELDLGAFLPDTSLPIDEVFFGATPLRKEVQELPPTGKVVFADKDAEKAEYNFGFDYQPSSLGQSEYAFRRVLHFLHSNVETVEVRRQNREAIAIMPYPERLALRARSALVIQARQPTGQNYISVRERALAVSADPVVELPLDREDGDAYGDDILSRWKQADDIIVGGSDDDEGEEDSDIDSRSASESEAEEVEEEGVSRSRITEVVDAEVQKIVREWHETKLPALEVKKAWSIWKETKQSRTLRDNKIAEAQAQVRHLTKRLSEQRQAYEADEWSSDDALRQVCKNLHGTVEDRELLNWKISVWKRIKEPVRTVNHRGDSSSSRHEHHTITAAKHPDFFAVNPDDRMSVEPTTPNHVHSIATPIQAEDGDDEMDEDASGEERANFVTPEGTPSPDNFIASDGHVSDDLAGEVLTSGEAAAVEPINYPPTLAMGSGTLLRRQVVNGMSSDNDTQSEGLSPLQSFMKPKPSQGIRRSPTTPTRTLRHGGLSTQPILISSSDAELTDHESSPEPYVGTSTNGKGKGKAESRSSANTTAKDSRSAIFNSEPHHATGDDVDSWNLKTLRELNDRQRILIKLLKEAGPAKRQSLHDSLLAIGMPPDRMKELQSAIQTLITGAGSDLNPDTGADMVWCAQLAMAWYLPAEFQSAELPWSDLKKDENQLRVFLGSLNKFLARKDDKLFRNEPRPSRQDVVLITDDEEEDQGPRETPHKKRKREVKQSHAALMARSRARARHDQFTQQVDSQEAISSQTEARNTRDASRSSLRINPHYKRSADDDELPPPPIYIHRKIAEYMKPHQVDGVQFMWREVTAAGEEGGQGCLLAHTMGLGKTMQSIALLAAIVEASESPDREIRLQLPANLRPRDVGCGKNKRRLRLMILCPPVLITNWRHEIERWAGPALGHVFTVEAASKANQKQDLDDWYRVGGVLIIGNAVFRNFFQRKKTEDEAAMAARLARSAELLLRGPEVVVADEVHHYKNADAAISRAVNRIETHTRIGLTGTPMSNDVSEIYSLVNWAAPDFLGDPIEFKAKFQEPIENGMYWDSTSYEIRRSIMKLKVLHHEIQPKVHRADITVLKGSLKPKTEFVITVPLTDTQAKTYRRYVDALVGGGRNEKASQVAIFGWLAVLMLLTNHPSAFMRKLLAPPAPKKKGKSKAPIELEGIVSRDISPGNAAVSREVALEQGVDPEAFKAPGDEEVRTLGFSHEQIQQILGDLEDSLDPALSAKVSILMEILRLSKECGDQVLLFSHSIPTLNFLQQLFKDKNITHGRLDGKSAMKDRLPLIEAFNAKEFNVLLISTRTGGTGLNIQGANRVIIFDFSFNPSWELQAVGRAYRFGQQKPVYVYRFVAGGTFETNLYNKQMFKTGLANRVVDKKNTRRSAQRNTKDYLYPPKPVPQHDLLQWKGKDSQVLDKLLDTHGPNEPGKIDTLMRRIETMEVLQQEGEDAPLNEEEQRQVNEMIEAEKTTGRGAGGSRRKTTDVLRGPPASTAPSMSAARSTVHARSMMLPPPPHGLPSAPLSTPAAASSGGQFLNKPPSSAPESARSKSGPESNMPNGLPFVSPSSLGRPRGQ